MGTKSEVVDGAISLIERFKNNFGFQDVAKDALRRQTATVTKDIANARGAMKVIKDPKITENIAKNLRESIKKEGYLKGADRVVNQDGISTIDRVKNFRTARQNISEAINPEQGMVGKVLNEVGTAKSLTGGYFLGGSTTRNASRIGLASAAYAGVNITGRKISGGSIGKNNKGEKDIAGIPFI